MEQRNNRVLNEAQEVGRRLLGTRLPAYSSSEYGAEEVSWAEQVRKPRESAMEAHARLVASGTSLALRALRIAGGVARMFEGNGDPRPLLLALGFKPGEEDEPNAADDYEARLWTWQGACELAELAREDYETVGAALRRLVEENGCVAGAFHYVTSTKRGW